MPGMGGVNRNINFRLNCDGWEVLRKENPLTFVNFLERPVNERIPDIRLAPITGAVENIGFESEREWYLQLFTAAHNTGLKICVGDGFPDEKIKYGLEAVKKIQKTQNTRTAAHLSQKESENQNRKPSKAAFFIKPFENKKILEHADLILPAAQIIGVDIDSYNISTMKNLIPLEKKTSDRLIEIKNYIHSKGLEFAIKGIFNPEDIELVKEVKPDIAYISNHGGRVETRIGSTAEFLQNWAEELKKNASKLWVDGGIRSSLDVATAMAFGADTILVGRPFISAFCKGGEELLCKKVLELSLISYGG